MAGAGRGEPKGSYHRDGTAASRAHYGQGAPASLESILAEHGYVLDSPGMPTVDGQGRRTGQRFGKGGARWVRDNDGDTGQNGGGGYISGGDPDPGAQNW